MFGRLACLVGRHRWVERLDGRETYTVCERCGRRRISRGHPTSSPDEVLATRAEVRRLGAIRLAAHGHRGDVAAASGEA